MRERDFETSLWHFLLMEFHDWIRETFGENALYASDVQMVRGVPKFDVIKFFKDLKNDFLKFLLYSSLQLPDLVGAYMSYSPNCRFDQNPFKDSEVPSDRLANLIKGISEYTEGIKSPGTTAIEKIFLIFAQQRLLALPFIAELINVPYTQDDLLRFLTSRQSRYDILNEKYEIFPLNEEKIRAEVAKLTTEEPPPYIISIGYNCVDYEQNDLGLICLIGGLHVATITFNPDEKIYGFRFKRESVVPVFPYDWHPHKKPYTSFLIDPRNLPIKIPNQNYNTISE